ncbi:MAG TPA: hypothetical protein VLG76_00240 [Rhabdochlamydiaceae bacterium]|nr:hypothetical protein [Rhabdochlamydiaceae bacterium]
MTEFDRPVDETNRHRDEGVLVPAIEGDKKGKEDFANLPEPIKKILNAVILVYLKSLFDSYHLQPQSEEEKFEKNQLLEDLETFKNLLNHLGAKDQSKYPKFAQQLSELWHKIDQNFNVIKFFEKDTRDIILKLKKIIEEVNHYPKDQEHSFGYYLKEHVGEDWLPFPYMEILSNLHKEHQRKPHESQIANWISRLDNIIESLK